MKKLSGCFLFLMFITLPAFAQTNFSKWGKFQSDRFDFQMNYPESWVVNETDDGQYRFYGEYSLQGTFYLEVMEKGDSSGAETYITELKNKNSGSHIDSSAGRTMLMYKNVKINNGQEVEIHNWVLKYKNRVFHCRYEFPAKLRNTPNINNELLLTYQMIESIIFTN